MDEPLAQALHTLQTSDTALVSGDFAVVYRQGRWHLTTLTYFGQRHGLHTVNFMSDERAQPLIAEWLPHARLIPFNQISATFAHEVQTKLLPRAADYLPFLERDWVDIGGGPTTDSQWFAHYDAAQQTAFLDRIAQMMDSGASGPYLRFHRLDVSESAD